MQAASSSLGLRKPKEEVPSVPTGKPGGRAPVVTVRSLRRGPCSAGLFEGCYVAGFSRVRKTANMIQLLLLEHTDSYRGEEMRLRCH